LRVPCDSAVHSPPLINIGPMASVRNSEGSAPNESRMPSG